MCLVPRLDEFECQGQRSRSPGTKNALYTSITPRPRPNGTHSQQMTSRSGKWHHSVSAGGGGLFRQPCVRCMFGKTSLALVFLYISVVPVLCVSSYTCVEFVFANNSSRQQFLCVFVYTVCWQCRYLGHDRPCLLFHSHCAVLLLCKHGVWYHT